jgi:hypothetical protein
MKLDLQHIVFWVVSSHDTSWFSRLACFYGASNCIVDLADLTQHKITEIVLVLNKRRLINILLELPHHLHHFGLSTWASLEWKKFSVICHSIQLAVSMASASLTRLSLYK